MTEVTWEDREMLGEAARSWVQKNSPVSALRAATANHATLGHDPSILAEMAAMGWFGILVPTDRDGSDLGFESVAVLMEELGRTLTPSPLLSSAVGAVSALLLGGSDAQKEHWLPRLGDASAIGTLAFEESARHHPEMIETEARPSDGGWTLSGHKILVEAGMAADMLVVAARTSGKVGQAEGLTLFLCETANAGITRAPHVEVDNRGRAVITFDEVRVDQVVGEIDKGHQLLERIIDRLCAASAAEMLGGTLQAFELTVEYLKVRKQFGQLIGSFQALQHRAADILADIELARSAVYEAAQAIDKDDERVPLLTSVAKVVAGHTFQRVAREMIQLHGGIGMTDEHDAGLYFKRAYAADSFGGNAAFHRDRYARLIGI